MRRGASCGPSAQSWRGSPPHPGTGDTPAGAGWPGRPAWEGRFFLEATERSHREGELCPPRQRPRGEGRGGDRSVPSRARTCGRNPPRRPQSPRRNWCERPLLASPSAPARGRRARASRARRGFARRGPVCGEPGTCMKRWDPAEQRRTRAAAAAAARGRSRAAPFSGPRWMRGWGAAHGPELRLPGASGRVARGAAEARRRRRRRKRRRSGAPGPGGRPRSAAASAAAAPGSPCSWPRPWWSGNG